MMYQNDWHIASYPRSGNHLVRAILEAYSHRPTEGCLGIKSDTPIYRRPSNGSGVIQIKNQAPIGFKSHLLREIHTRDMNAKKPLGLILITRDPVHAISSQATRILRPKYGLIQASKRRRRRTIEQQIDVYLALVFRYCTQHPTTRIHILFEDLTSQQTANATCKNLLSNVGLKFQGPELEQVMKVAKESQFSLKDNSLELKQELEDMVAEKLNYSDVLNYIRSSDERSC